MLDWKEVVGFVIGMTIIFVAAMALLAYHTAVQRDCIASLKDRPAAEIQMICKART